MMKFLFHMPLDISDKPVYVNVLHHERNRFFIEILDNPHKLITANNFFIKLENEVWKKEDGGYDRNVQIIGEELERFFHFKSYDRKTYPAPRRKH